jgi:hypothetical protein
VLNLEELARRALGLAQIVLRKTTEIPGCIVSLAMQYYGKNPQSTRLPAKNQRSINRLVVSSNNGSPWNYWQIKDQQRMEL